MTRILLGALTVLATPFLCVGFVLAYWADAIQSERNVRASLARQKAKHGADR